jgi:hypothetical protein
MRRNGKKRADPIAPRAICSSARVKPGKDLLFERYIKEILRKNHDRKVMER